MTSEFRSTLLSRFMRMRRGPWENLATVIIAVGVLMLLQPISLTLYTYSFVTMLAGTAMFVIVSKFPE
jgi:drug/metabolite transporter (DMT)-like permease